MAIQYNLHVDAGATFVRDLVYTNPDGTLFDLTGYTAKLQIRPSATSATKTLEVIPEINVTTATVTFTFTAIQTAALAGSYVYAIELYAPTGGVVIRLAGGAVVVSPEVVR